MRSALVDGTQLLKLVFLNLKKKKISTKTLDVILLRPVAACVDEYYFFFLHVPCQTHLYGYDQDHGMNAVTYIQHVLLHNAVRLRMVLSNRICVIAPMNNRICVCLCAVCTMLINVEVVKVLKIVDAFDKLHDICSGIIVLGVEEITFYRRTKFFNT